VFRVLSCGSWKIQSPMNFQVSQTEALLKNGLRLILLVVRGKIQKQINFQVYQTESLPKNVSGYEAFIKWSLVSSTRGHNIYPCI